MTNCLKNIANINTENFAIEWPIENTHSVYMTAYILHKEW